MVLTERIEMRIDKSTRKVLRELAEAANEPESTVARGLLEMALDSATGNRSLHMKYIRESIELTEEVLEDLKKRWEKLTGQPWGDQ